MADPGTVNAEPPPGVYRDADGDVFVRRIARSGDTWTIADDGAVDLRWIPWAEARELICGPLVPLWTADELIPDPDDLEAVERLQMDAGHTSPQRPIIDVLRILRARAASASESSPAPTVPPSGGSGPGETP